MGRLFKVALAFAAAGLLILLAVSFLENEYGFESNASEILAEIVDFGEKTVSAADEFLETSGIRKGVQNAYSKAVTWIGLEDTHNADEETQNADEETVVESDYEQGKTPDPEETQVLNEE